jgi:hypothetical protein
MKRRTPPVDERSEGSRISDDETGENTDGSDAVLEQDGHSAGERGEKRPVKQPRSTDARFRTPSLTEAASIRQSSAVEDISHAVELDRATIVSLEVSWRVLKEFVWSPT